MCCSFISMLLSVPIKMPFKNCVLLPWKLSYCCGKCCCRKRKCLCCVFALDVECVCGPLCLYMVRNVFVLMRSVFASNIECVCVTYRVCFNWHMYSECYNCVVSLGLVVFSRSCLHESSKSCPRCSLAKTPLRFGFVQSLHNSLTKITLTMCFVYGVFQFTFTFSFLTCHHVTSAGHIVTCPLCMICGVLCCVEQSILMEQGWRVSLCIMISFQIKSKITM